jgi:hypothetical protein
MRNQFSFKDPRPYWEREPTSEPPTDFYEPEPPTTGPGQDEPEPSTTGPGQDEPEPPF